MSQPAYIDALWLTIAFACGIIAKRISLPPLIGFLVTGFILNATGLTQGHIREILQVLSDLGVMLLLFTIGLKINIQNLIRREIWATATIHMIISVLALSSVVFLLSFTGFKVIGDFSFKTSLLIGFALSFSSTVFVVKVLEERGELNSYHGKIAIGILVIQDIFAVLFITFSKGEWPSVWALGLPLYLWLIKHLLNWIFNLVDHGELLTIFGMFAAFISGALIFYAVGLKADLGALVAGMLLTTHPRSKELYDRMMGYKDFFLTAFFINIGLSGIPGAGHIITALILVLLVNLKGGLFLFILSRFRLRARTAFLASISLGNYSEFALITGVVGMKAGWITEDWIMILAVAMSLSFLVTSPLNRRAHDLFDHFKPWIARLNRRIKSDDEEPMTFGDARYLIVGMGDIGISAYKYLAEHEGAKVAGIDYNIDLITQLREEGYNVSWGDATDSNLWDEADLSSIGLVIFALDDFPTNLNSIKEIKKVSRYNFEVGVISHFPDQEEKFRELGVDHIYNYRLRLGRDLVESLLEQD